MPIGLETTPITIPQTGTMPVIEEPYNADDLSPTPWSTAADLLGSADTYWLATVRPDGRPHVVPVLAVWVDDTLHFVASDISRKAVDLARDARCTITTHGKGLDLVVDGEATKATDGALLPRVADAYAAKYDWHVTISDGTFDAEGAPTAGPRPYAVYAVAPSTAFDFPTAGRLTPTRWRFPQ
jgi:hypothetical protein